MNKTLVEIEDKLKLMATTGIDYLKDKNVKTIPPDFDTRVLAAANNLERPSVLYGYQGGQSDPKDFGQLEDPTNGEKSAVWKETLIWSIWVVTYSLKSVDKQLRGDLVKKGAYTILEDLKKLYMAEVLFDGFTPVLLTNWQLALKTSGTAVYRIDLTTSQDNTKILNKGY